MNLRGEDSEKGIDCILTLCTRKSSVSFLPPRCSWYVDCAEAMGPAAVQRCQRQGSRTRIGTVAGQQLTRRLFVVSQDPELQSSVLLALDRRKFHLRECATLEEVLDAVRRPERDVILFDTDTSGLGPVEGLRAVRRAAGALPLIVVTSDDSVEMGKQIVQERVFFYTVKPVNVWEVGAIIEAAWENVENRLRRDPWTKTQEHPAERGKGA